MSGRRQGGGGPLSKLAGGIGLAAEAIQHHRNKSKSPKPETETSRAAVVAGSSNIAPASASRSEQHPPCSEHQPQETSSELFQRDDGVTEHDEAIWQLDEAAAELDSDADARKAVIPQGIAKEPARISVLVDAFVSAHPPVTDHDGPADLPCPVIIPQRRPQARTRGFVRAYSPYLDPCGISEDVFMQFLDFFDESLKYSNVIKVVQLAGAVVGFVPGITTMVVSAAIGVGSQIASTAQSTQRNNDFITRMNQQYFMPMGLVCLIMKFKPEQRSGGYDVDASVARASKNVHTNFHSSHGKTNEIEMPLAAPLVFPTLDHSDDQEKLSKFARSMRFIAQYQDRRAQAKFEMDNPDSKLASSMQSQTKFESSLADPRKQGNGFSLRGGLHSMTSEYTGLGGGLGQGRSIVGPSTARQDDEYYQDGGHGVIGGRRGLIGGGLIGGGLISSRVATRRDVPSARRGWDSEGSYGLPGQQVGRSRGDRRGGLLGAGPIGLIQKALKQDVLYMMIVPMPTREEMEQADFAPPENAQFVEVRT